MRTQRFALALLRTMGFPETDNNIRSILAWIRLEGGHYFNAARYNPLNTTQPMPGSHKWGGTVPIQVYSSWQEGLDATAKTLRYPAYATIRAGLSASRPPEEVHQAIDKTPWGTHNYQAGSAVGLSNAAMAFQDPYEGQGGDFAILGAAQNIATTAGNALKILPVLGIGAGAYLLYRIIFKR